VCRFYQAAPACSGKTGGKTGGKPALTAVAGHGLHLALAAGMRTPTSLPRVRRAASRVPPSVVACLAALLAATGAAASTPPPGPPLSAALDLRFEAGEGARTLVEGTVAVPVAEAVLNAYGFYNLQLEGEVKVEGRTYDHFVYRFDVPGKTQLDAPLALSFQRTLRPGSFQLAIKVKDVQSGRVALLERPLQVPRVEPATPALPGGTAPVAPPAAASAVDVVMAAVSPAPVASAPLLGADFPTAATPHATATAAAAAPPSAPTIHLVPPPRVAVGLQRFEAVAQGDAVDRVTFALDGRPMMTRTRPPFSVEIDLGDRAVRRRLRVEALAADGRRLASDEVELNTDGDGFAVRLRRPPVAAQQSGVVTARAEVVGPAGERVDRIELFLDDRLVATLVHAPWERQLTLRGSAPTLLRAVAYLADGTSAEDSVLLNAPQAHQVDVDLVELYTAVVDRQGRPVRGLDARDFRVFEQGEPQRLDRFAEVADLPVHLALSIDTSTSMTLRLTDVKRAAQAFLRELVGPKDEVMLITFDNAPHVRVSFTHDMALLGNGLEGLEARGGTALYDSLVFALEELQKVRGQRVLVLLSDGLDERSHSSADDVLELARRAAVTLYTIGIADSRAQAPEIDRPLLDKLAAETGGRSFYVDRMRALDGVYAEIERDMRARYLLAYYSSHAGERAFRVVDVKLPESRLSARTIRGYYP
jgi:VWFA-related protein